VLGNSSSGCGGNQGCGGGDVEGSGIVSASAAGIDEETSFGFIQRDGDGDSEHGLGESCEFGGCLATGGDGAEQRGKLQGVWAAWLCCLGATSQNEIQKGARLTTRKDFALFDHALHVFMQGHQKKGIRRRRFRSHLCVLFHRVKLWQHAPVKNANDECELGCWSVEDDVATHFHAMQIRPDVVASAAQQRLIDKSLASGFHLREISRRLLFAPAILSVNANPVQVRLGVPGEFEGCHRLALSRGEFQRFANSGEGIAWDDTAGVTLVDSDAQGSEFGFKLSLFAVESTQRRADDLAGIPVAAFFDLACDKPVLFYGEIDIACWHGGHLGSWV